MCCPQVDPFTLGYEHEVLKVMQKWRKERRAEGKGYELYINLGLSFVTESRVEIQLLI